MIASHHAARVLSIGTGMPLNAVTWRLQLLKKAGLLPKDGPGTAGHVPLTPRDLAVCLLGMAAPTAKEAPAVVELHGALPFASASGKLFRNDGGRGPLIVHLTDIFHGAALDVLARLLTDPAGRAIHAMSIDTGAVSRVRIDMLAPFNAEGTAAASAEYALAGEAHAGSPGIVDGCRRAVNVCLQWPTFGMVRGLVEADARGGDLNVLLIDESGCRDPADIAHALRLDCADFASAAKALEV